MVGYPRTVNATTTGVVIDASQKGDGVFPLPEPYARTFALAVTGVGGTPTSFSVNLEGSLDGTNFTNLVTASANGTMVWAVDKPCNFLRVNVTALSLAPATSINCSFLAVP